jgi:hypothetical protein
MSVPLAALFPRTPGRLGLRSSSQPYFEVGPDGYLDLQCCRSEGFRSPRTQDTVRYNRRFQGWEWLVSLAAHRRECRTLDDSNLLLETSPMWGILVVKILDTCLSPSILGKEAPLSVFSSKTNSFSKLQTSHCLLISLLGLFWSFGWIL